MGFSYGTKENTNDLSTYSEDAFAAYLAGFIDADGSIGIAKQSEGARSKKPIYRARVQIGQKRSAVAINLFNEIQHRYGGNIHESTRVMQGPTPDLRLIKYIASNEVARKILEATKPYLTQKHDQAAAALVFLEIRKNAQHPWSEHDRKLMETMYQLEKMLIASRNK